VKRFLSLILAALSASVFGATLVPVQLLNPTGSSSGQAIVSTGSSSAPGWSTLGLSGLSAISANSLVGNATNSSASPTAVSVTGCNGAAQALQWTNGSGFGCNSSIATSGANANITSMTGLQTQAISNSLTSGVTQSISSTSNTATGAAILMTGNGATTPSKYLQVLGGTFNIINSAGSADILSLTDGGNLSVAGSLAAPGNDALLYSNSAGQSISSGTQTTLTTWTKNFDRVNANFNASTGTFTAPATDYYQVSAQLCFASHVGVVNAQYSVAFVVGGSNVYVGSFYQESTSTDAVCVPASSIVTMTSGQTLVIQAFQNTGGSVSMATSGTVSYLSINRIP